MKAPLRSSVTVQRRPPPRGGGFKFKEAMKAYTNKLSPSTRRAWIEIVVYFSSHLKT